MAADEGPLQLPRADEAEIDPKKLTHYALNADHPDGGPKARGFAVALGIGPDDWEFLRGQILERLPSCPYTRIDVDAWGRRYTVPISIDGLNGATCLVITAWFVERASDRPRLVSLYARPS